MSEMTAASAGTGLERRLRQRLLLRGESAVASAGLVLASILLVTMGASAWWTFRTQHAALTEARQQQAQAIAAILSQSAEVMLGANELTAVRRLIADASRDYQLNICRIVLPSGKVVADADPSKITAMALPASWGGAVHDAMSIEGNKLLYPLMITGRGPAQFEIEPALTMPWWTHWNTQAGVGGIGAAALVGLLVVYRVMRTRITAMSLIREALLSLAHGEKTVTALAVSPSLGPEALAWNGLLEEKEKLSKQMVIERVRESLSATRGGGKSELEAACDAMSQGLILVDERMRVKYANGAAAVFMQIKRENLVGGEVERFIQHPGLVEAVRSVAVLGMLKRLTVEVEQKTDQSTGVLRYSVRPVRKDDAAAAMVTIDDITQQRVAEESRNAFVAKATHELRTPLTNIRLYVETAIDEGEQNPTMRANCLNVINQEARRLERIVGEMLSVAEIEAGSFRIRRDDIYVDALFEQLKGDYAAQATEKQIELVFNLPPKLPVIKGDRDKILVALHNLIGNSLKYTPDGGKVNVTVEYRGGRLTVDVTDTGIGIGSVDVARVFDKFYRAKDARVGKIQGTGLGLTLAREVARLHGGDIEVESQLDKGSTFMLTLPAPAEGA
jgi:signal transduction histidine kinase